MKILVFDTETTSLEKPFAYNIGYCIADTETGKTLIKRDYVAEQVWHNLELFCSAYYADKRPIYVERMRARSTIMDKFGYICGQMIRDIKAFDVHYAFAFNSAFDERVFNFCCDWFKCKNPFDNVAIHDIRGYVHKHLITDNYKKFCEDNALFTESGHYSTTAETVYRYISDNTEFNEEHTALADSEIETEILFECIRRGADITIDEPAKRSIERLIERTLTIKQGDKTDTYTYTKRTNRDGGDTIILK